MKQEKGFVVGADSKQEWLLPWWWENYKKHNSYPVTFVDFGLSLEMKRWCQERGHYVFLSSVPTVESTQSEMQIESWELRYGKKLWDHRSAWFKKPLACFHSPYDQSVWMDLDCEVRGALDFLFSLELSQEEVALTKEYLRGEELGVNSGVILFQKGASIIEEWAKASFNKNHAYPGDQDALYALIKEKGTPVQELPIIYNHSRFSHDHSEAVVVHWHGEEGKDLIRKQINLASE